MRTPTKMATRMTRSVVFRHVLCALIMSLFFTGCGSISGTHSRTIVSQSYDLPSTLEANAVIRAVERAFARNLAMPPRIVEGSVSTPLPPVPARFRVENRQMYLDRLGLVSAPRVNCPESMAVVHAFVVEAGGSSSLQSYTACIQLYAGGYRVSLVAGRMVLEGLGDVAGPTDLEQKSGPLSRIAQALRDQFSEMQLVPDSQVPESVDVASLAPSAEQSDVIHSARDAVSTFPLVCLVPSRESASVKSARGDGHVIKILDARSIMAVPEPIDPAYYRVNTEDGMAGWVNRSDVRRLPCPIG